MSKKYWHDNFGPCYTPMEMIELGIFEGLYTAAIKGIPAKYKKSDKVLKRGSEPDISLNKFGVKSRQSLKQWEKNGWTTEDSPLGWFEWYVKYFEGRRLEKEDEWQIKRWNSFIKRHNGQMRSSSNWKNKGKWLKSKQGQLQWAWDFNKEPTEATIKRNARKMAKATSCELLTKEAISSKWS